MSTTEEKTKSLNQSKTELRGRDYYKKYGPLCTSEGFYQHRGECWSDSFQMIMLYTDGIKEFTQEKLANEEIEFKTIEEQFEPFVKKMIEKYGFTYSIENFKTNNLRAIFLYFKAVQERFRRHYMAEVERYSRFGPIQCYSFEKVGKDSLQTLREIAKLYRSQNTGVEKSGIRAAIMGKGSYNAYKFNREGVGKNTSYNKSILGFAPGGNTDDIEYLVQIYSLFFSINLSLNTQNIKQSATVEINITAPCHWMHIGSYNIGRMHHAVCFLQCGGKQYYYDDNEGIFLFPWKEFINFYNTLLSETSSTSSSSTSSNSTKSNLKIIFGSLAQIKDKTTGTVLFETFTYPFISQKLSTEEIRYTFVSEDKTPIKIRIPLEKSTFYEEVLEQNDKLYLFSFTKKNVEFELIQMLSIINLSTEYKKASYNVNTGSLLGSRLKPIHSNLQKAILLENAQSIRKLLNTQQLDINQTDKDKNTMLHVAVQLNDMDLTKRLVETPGIDLTKKNRDGETPLTLAILNKHYEIVKYLLSKDMGIIKVPNNNGIYPVEMLIGENNLTNSPESFELIELLAPIGNFEHFANKHFYYTTKVKNWPLLKLFIKYGLNLNKLTSKEYGFYDEFYPLEYAVNIGDLELFTFFLENGADPEFVPNPKYQPTRKVFHRLLYPLDNYLTLEMKAKFMEQLEKYTPKKGGQFSQTRKNSRTKKRKTRKGSH